MVGKWIRLPNTLSAVGWADVVVDLTSTAVFVVAAADIVVDLASTAVAVVAAADIVVDLAYTAVAVVAAADIVAVVAVAGDGAVAEAEAVVIAEGAVVAAAVAVAAAAPLSRLHVVWEKYYYFSPMVFTIKKPMRTLYLRQTPRFPNSQGSRLSLFTLL